MKNGCALVCCSDARPLSEKPIIDALVDFLHKEGLSVAVGKSVCYDGVDSVPSPQQKADELTQFFCRDDIRYIFDISGGDSANSILPYLDYERIAQSDALFFGYSDLTSVINAVLAKTGKPSVLYQVRNVIRSGSERTKAKFRRFLSGETDIFHFEYEMLRGKAMNGVTVGGNIRCLLKLAGTQYFPDTENKLLVLESLGGDARRICAYFDQLSQIKVFAHTAGIILGTFTQAEKNGELSQIVDYLLSLTDDIPIIKTDSIGHAHDVSAVFIGKELRIERK